MDQKRLSRFDVINLCILSCFALIIAYPFYNSLLVSLTAESEYVRTPFMLFPKNITFNSYIYVFLSDKIWSGYRVTGLILLLGVPYNMLLTVCTAYALSKSRYPGKAIIMNLIIITMYFGGGLIPYYLLIRNLNLINHIAVLIIPYGLNTFYMLIVRNFFQNIPASIEESARIDGANEVTILFRIILPVSLPVLATVILFYSVDRWNDWFGAVLFIRDVRKQPLQLVLRSIIAFVGNVDAKGVPPAIQNNVFSDGVKMASIFIVMAPVMMIYPFIQKYFMKGIMLGAIKS